MALWSRARQLLPNRCRLLYPRSVQAAGTGKSRRSSATRGNLLASITFFRMSCHHLNFHCVPVRADFPTRCFRASRIEPSASGVTIHRLARMQATGKSSTSVLWSEAKASSSRPWAKMATRSLRGTITLWGSGKQETCGGWPPPATPWLEPRGSTLGALKNEFVRVLLNGTSVQESEPDVWHDWHIGISVLSDRTLGTGTFENSNYVPVSRSAAAWMLRPPGAAA